VRKSLKKSSVRMVQVVSSIFCDRRFSFSEALIWNLRGEGYGFNEIAQLLNRDDRTIWTLYHRAEQKSVKEQVERVISREIIIPSSVFRDRSLSIMEVLVVYLKEDRAFTYREIGQLLQRNERTIWTIYSRAGKKKEIKK
jgi:hypothetical protein